MLAVLFSGENDFLLIDEPTNHLDMASREIVKRYLAGKKGFILVSHDRDLLDACIDHVLVLNRATIEVQKGESLKLPLTARQDGPTRTKGQRSDLIRSRSMTGQSQPGPTSARRQRRCRAGSSHSKTVSGVK